MSESRRQRRALERAYKKYREKLYRDAFRRAKEQKENEGKE